MKPQSSNLSLVLLGAGENTEAPLLKERLLRATELANAFPESNLWVIGNNITAKETDAMIQALQGKVDNQRLYRIDSAKNTRESFQLLQQKLTNNQSGTVAIATNDFHLSRSIATAQRHNFKVKKFEYKTNIYKEVSLKLRTTLWIRERASKIKFYLQGLQR